VPGRKIDGSVAKPRKIINLPPMKIAIIGAGNVGTALGQGWAKAGHTIIYGVRNPDGGKSQSSADGTTSQGIPDAVQQAEVVALAVPWTAIDDAVTAMGSVKGKVVIDCTNPLLLNSEGSLSLALGSTTSGAEEIERKLPGAFVAKAFNTYGWENFANSSYPGYGDVKPVMFFCSDSDEAKKAVQRLATDLGFEPLDTGGLGMARSLEPLALLWIRLAIREGRNPNFVWGVLRR